VKNIVIGRAEVDVPPPAEFDAAVLVVDVPFDDADDVDGDEGKVDVGRSVS